MCMQGGQSWNSSPQHKAGLQSRFKCSICGRSYKQEYPKERHYKNCKQYNHK